MSEYQNTEVVLQKNTPKIGLKNSFPSRKYKNTVPWTHVTNGLNNEGILGIFYEKELHKKKKVEFRIENVITRNEAIIAHSIAGLI